MRFVLISTFLISALPLSAVETYVVLDSIGKVVRVPADGSAITFTTNNSGGNDFAIDANGNYIIATGTGLAQLTAAGAFTAIASAPSGGSTMVSVAIDTNGDYIVVDNGKHQLLRVTAANHTVSVIVAYPVVNGGTCTAGCEDTVVRVDSAGNYILIEDNGNSVHLYRVAPGGALTTVTITGVTPARAGGLTFDQSGNYVIADFLNGALDVVTPTGSGSTLIQNSTLAAASLAGVVRDPATGNYIASGYQSNSLYSISSTGAGFTQITTGGAIFQPLSVAITGATTTQSVPSPVSVSNAAGSGLSSNFQFVFSDTGGAQNLSVLNVLINNFLDGRKACYIAYVPAGNTGTIYLVDDGGDSAGPYSGTQIGTGTAHNSQCSINGALSTVQSNGTTLTLTLNITFTATFTGNKIMYMAARETVANSGWSALGTWNVPGTTPTGPSVTGLAQGRTSGLSQTYQFTFTDTNGWQDIAVANVLINSAIDGRKACYIAYVPGGAATGLLDLVDNAGDAGGPFSSFTIPSNNVASNSQCSVGTSTTTVSASGNTMILTLQITFNNSFAGNQIIYAAARSNTVSSDWQAVGSVAVP